MKPKQSVINTLQFIEAIQSKREDEELSLRKASIIIGISPSTLCRIEDGIEPNIYAYYSICKWLGVNYPPTP